MKKIIFLFIPMAFFVTCSMSIAQETSRNYSLPELLAKPSGKKIESVKEWEKTRRPWILDRFREEVYGRVPENKIKVWFEITDLHENALCKKAIQKFVTIHISNDTDTHGINLLIYLPKNLPGPVPLFLGMNFYGNHTIQFDPRVPITEKYVKNKAEFCIFNHTADSLSRGARAYRWPVERILERGYGLASIYYGDLDPDYPDFNNGVHPLFYQEGQEKPKPGEWGAISAWAYGLSRAMDYFETDAGIDHERIAVFGHSRLGKTALWAGAQDTRFALVISNNSGCGGAALSRRKQGETVAQINKTFPHWFCQNFHHYNNREEDLPVDQHMLLALIAPRPVYVASAEQDQWADPTGEFLSLYHAGAVYELYGHEKLPMDTLPPLNQPSWGDRMGYHFRSGKHDITRYDWERYMDFADLHLKQSK